MGSRQRTKEGMGVGAFAQGQRGQLQAYRPPLGPGVQRGDPLCSQVQPPHFPAARMPPRG